MDEEHSPTASERRSALRIVATSVVAITFLAQDVLGLLEHGGLWSVAAALRAAGDQVPDIDVDSTALRSAITLATCLTLALVFGWLKVDIRRRWPAVVVLVAMIGGSLAVDAVFDEPIVEQLMTARGYDRCPSGDHAVGSGRSKVWFDRFVSARLACRAPPSER